MSITNRLNRTILLTLSSFIIGIVIGYISMVLLVAAAMTGQIKSPGGIIFYLLLILTIIPFIVSFFTPLWYFFIKKDIVQSRWSSISQLFILIGFNIITTSATILYVDSGRIPDSVELIPSYLIIIFSIIIIMRLLLIFFKTTPSRSQSAYNFIQFVFFYFLFVNIFFTLLSTSTTIIGFDIEKIYFIEVFLIIVVLIIASILPILFIIFLYDFYKDNRMRIID